MPKRMALDHIVVGHRGHTLFERWPIGSVARHVIAYAPTALFLWCVRVALKINKEENDGDTCRRSPG